MSRTITVSLDEETDRALRSYANAKYGKKKGYLGKAYKEAIEMMIKKEEQERISEEAIAFLDKGIKIRKHWKFNRDEAHER